MDNENVLGGKLKDQNVGIWSIAGAIIFSALCSRLVQKVAIIYLVQIFLPFYPSSLQSLD